MPRPVSEQVSVTVDDEVTVVDGTGAEVDGRWGTDGLGEAKGEEANGGANDENNGHESHFFAKGALGGIGGYAWRDEVGGMVSERVKAEFLIINIFEGSDRGG